MYTAEQRGARAEELIGALKDADGRVTHQRVAVISTLLNDENHPSAEDIYQALKPTYPMLSFATVYKTLNKLKTMGEVLELEFREGSNRYDGMRPLPHAHLICTECGRIQDVEVEAPVIAAQSAAEELGYELLGTRFDLYGECQSCLSKRE